MVCAYFPSAWSGEAGAVVVREGLRVLVRSDEKVRGSGSRGRGRAELLTPRHSLGAVERHRRLGRPSLDFPGYRRYPATLLGKLVLTAIS